MPTDGLSVLLQTLHATKRGAGWVAVCPHHHDANPSLDIKIGRKGCPVVICRVCGADQQREVVADIEALGVPKWVWSHEYEQDDTPKPRVVKETPYELRDWNGTLLATHVRKDLDRPNAKGKLKEFAYLRDGRWTLDGLSPNQLPLWGTELLRQFPRHGVVITEGEKDAAALRGAGVKLALGTLGAETKPQGEVLAPLVGRKRYILWPDHDEPGRAHMVYMAEALVRAGVAAELIQIVDWPDASKGAGAADYVATHSTAQVTEFLSRAPYWRRPPEEGPPADPLPAAPPPEVVASNGDGPHSALLLTWAKDLQPTEVEWLWKGYLPRGRITILQGDPGLGKSWFALAVATSLSLGAPLPHQEQLQAQLPPPQRTLLFAAEDDPNDTLAMRLTMMGADPSHVAILRAAELVDDKGKARQEHFTFSRHLELLDASLAEHKFSLLVFDPLSAYFGASVDSHKDNEVRSIMGPLQEVVMRHKVACLCIMHLTKGSRDRAIYRGQGSIAFGALARVILLAGREPLRPERIAVVQIKNNLAPYAPTLAFDLQDDRLLWVPEGSEATEEDLLAAAPTSEERTAQQDCGDSIIDLLQDGSMEARKLEGRLHGQGFTTATIRRARRDLTAKAAINTERRGGLGGEGKWHVFLVQRGE